MQETVNLIRGPVTRSMAKKIEEENNGMVALFGNNFQDLSWHALEKEDEDKYGTKTLPGIRGARDGIRGSNIGGLEGLNYMWPREEDLPSAI